MHDHSKTAGNCRRASTALLLSLFLLTVVLPAPAGAVPVISPSPGQCRLELLGGTEITLECGKPFQDPGWFIIGPIGAAGGRKVSAEGEVCPWRTGDYTLTYRLEDPSGEIIASAVRTVHVVPAVLPETVPVPGVIYLTFDDGPGQYTAEVLDILERHNIKATFFIIAGSSLCAEMLPRIAEAGHTVGIHCFSHGYDRLYRSEEDYFQDFLQAQEAVYRYTGQYAQVCRLPGGGRTAGYLYAALKGGYGEFREIMHDMGVRFYDWHIQPESSFHTRSGEIYSFTHPDEPYNGAICLLHDTRDYSVLALEDMIEWALDQGYTFLPITPTTPEIHFVRSDTIQY